MKRNLTKLVNLKYDLLVIGGGIAGAFVALDATLRGLSVALIEKKDFGGATSAASGKIIHGGIRFMQYGAFHRVYESLHERMVFRRIAPHMIQTVPFIVPTYGHLMKGKEILKIGMAVYELLSRTKRNSGDINDTIPIHRMLNRQQVIDFEEGLGSLDLNGGVLYHECQMHNPERLTLSVVFAAIEAGAQIANYVEAIDFIVRKDRVVGVRACDQITKDEYEINAKVVLNAAGPWASSLLSKLDKQKSLKVLRYSKGIHIVTRPITRKHAVALITPHKNANSIAQRSGRHYFVIPWRGYSLIGTTNEPFNGTPDDKMVTENNISTLIKDFNIAYPAGELSRSDVLAQYGGLYIDENTHTTIKGYQGNRKDQVVDHACRDQIKGLITCVCVKYTTARKLAALVVNKVFEKLEIKTPRCKTEHHHVFGGNIKDFSRYLKDAVQADGTLDKDITRQLVLNYGSKYKELFEYANDYQDWCQIVHPELPIIKAQLIHAVRKEMSVTLADVVFRRTGLGTVGHPGDSYINMWANIVAQELNWPPARTKMESAAVRKSFIP